MMNEADIREFWEANPCGDQLVASPGVYTEALQDFFTRYDHYRYSTETHILRCLDEINFEGKSTLEIGLGQGADSEQIIRRGAVWSGLDLTPQSVDRVRTRLTLRRLPYSAVREGSVVSIPYDSDSFDIVFSHGVLHHVPEIQVAQAEIARVLRPNGELIAMLYAKWSLNYLLSICLVRRLGLAALYLLGLDLGGIYGQHLVAARDAGLAEYLRMPNFLHKNTDGPANPFSRVYDLAAVRRDFPDFELIGAHRHFMHAPPIPVRWLPLAGTLGWHLWVHLRVRKESTATT